MEIFLTLAQSEETNCYNAPFARALEIELEEWWENLPERLRFDRDFQILNIQVSMPDGQVLAPQVDDRIAFLRTQYFGCQVTIHFYALHSLFSAHRSQIIPDHNLLGPSKKATLAAFRFIASISQLMDHPSPNLWTLSLRYYTMKISLLSLVCKRLPL
jgi:hypothetical protein